MKTLKEMKECSPRNIADFCRMGEEVEKEIVDYFINCIPPKTMTGCCVQLGEPYNYEQDTDGVWRETYLTFGNDNGSWKYCGNCFAGEVITPEQKRILCKGKTEWYYSFECMDASLSNKLHSLDTFTNEREAMRVAADYEATLHKVKMINGVVTDSVTLYDPYDCF